jgi:hypothetical protein
VVYRIAPRHWASRIIVAANEAWSVDYEDLSPEQVRLGGEMLEYPFLSGADAWLAQGVFKMWLTSSLIRQVV